MTRAHEAGAIPVWDTADRVAKARRHAGLDQDELAERAGVSRRSISRYENGAAEPRGAAIIAIAFACGVDVNWLRNGESPADPDGSNGGALCAIRDSNPEPAELAA